MTRQLSAALVLTSVLLAACGDDDGPSEPTSFTETFSLTVTGDVPGSVTGGAFFGVDTSEGEPVFGIILGNSTYSHTLMLVRPGNQRPAVGEYDISTLGSEENGWTGLYLIDDGEIAGMVVGTEGTLKITRSTSGRMTGTIQMDGTGFYGVGEEMEEIALTVSGSFDAKPTPAE